MAKLVPLLKRAIKALSVCSADENLKSLQHEIELLSSEIKHMQSFLKRIVEIPVQSKEVRHWHSSVHDAVNEADQVIDEMLLYSLIKKHCSVIDWLTSNVWPFSKLRLKFNLGHHIRILVGRIRDLNRDFEVKGIAKGPDQRGFKADLLNVTIAQEFVGIEEEMQRIVSLLLTEEMEGNSLGVIGTLGSEGIKETTLVSRVYKDSRIRRHFKCFAWVNVGQNSRMRNVFETLLLQLSESENREDLTTFSNLDLAREIFEFLHSNKCLVVLDNVDKDVWECLRIAIPSRESSSRVLLIDAMQRTCGIT